MSCSVLLVVGDAGFWNFELNLARIQSLDCEVQAQLVGS